MFYVMVMLIVFECVLVGGFCFDYYNVVIGIFGLVIGVMRFMVRDLSLFFSRKMLLLLSFIWKVGV